MMEQKIDRVIPKEKFAFVQKEERIHDEKLKTKSISYFGDAWIRFRTNKSAVIAFSLIMLLLIAATSLFSTDDKDNTNEGGGLW